MRNMVKKIIGCIKEPVKIWTNIGMRGGLNWLNTKSYISIAYKLTFGRKLRWDNPETYTEKINWCKLHWYNPLVEKCVDKYDVREYVELKIGKQYLNEVYGVWNTYEEINFEELPEQFVIKVTNGSGDVYLCSDKKKLDEREMKKRLDRYRRHNVFYANREWPYLAANRRYIAEKLIKSADGKAIKDYKIFCFYGEPKFCFVGSDRDTEVKFDFFDNDWNYIPVRNGHDHKNPLPERPQYWSEMLEVAAKLSEDFPHVRVDLYEEEGKVYFGELTFFHFGGFVKFEPDSFDYEFGKLFDLSRIPENERR